MAVGSEGRGLSAAVLAACGKTVRIPMDPRCESLNAASAASVLLWEAARDDY
nr:TrmH family RNA methyltransferase [uncultured Oscillibacter sp.]